MAMNMNNLKIFINVADAANITRAAEALRITQPAVSKAVKKLENDLGVTLFSEIKHYGRFKIVGTRTVRTIAEEGIGIGLQAESILPADTEKYFKYPVKPRINTDFVLIANRFDDLSPAARAFIETIHEIMQD